MVRSHQASSGRKMYDQAAERARRCGGVACRSTSAGCAVGLLEVMVPERAKNGFLKINIFSIAYT